ncbi:MAG: hypothetical protein A2171_02640 [Candidatus Levybacteria bacterium RBG_13_35_9]|nr:MAG: hypothetical protein A2171_02640 [Candidatus Levybacteria bacterium RBG_13_35_9]
MITIVHGNDIVSSRNFYLEFRTKLKDFQILDGKNFDYNTLIQVFEGNSLFTNEKNIFVEKFFSNNKSNSEEFKKITDYLNKNKSLNILFWEEKELTKTQVNSIKQADIKQFNYPQILFIFLDSLKPNNVKSILLFHQLKETMEEELIFFMIIRQFRLMLSVLEEGKDKIDEHKRLAPWQIGKLKSQAALFGKNKLLSLYKGLYKNDYETKYGLTPFNLSANIDFFLSDL